MRLSISLAAAAGALVLILGAPAHATGQNRDGVGIYSPAEPPTRDHPRAYRYELADVADAAVDAAYLAP